MNRRFQKECESSCEYILPDYLGDVRRVLKSSAKLIPSGQFNQEGSTECAGIVSYELVYSDADNNIASASFTSDYDFSFQIDGETHLSTYVSPSLAGYSVRLAGPRRVLGKASVFADVSIAESKLPTVSGTAFETNADIEKIEKELDSETMLVGESMEREYAEEIASLDEVSSEEIQVITSNAFVEISESTPVDGGVNIKGILVINAIIKTPEMSVFAIRREIPFDEIVKISGATQDMSAVSDVFATSVSCSTVDDGGNCKINANVILEMKSALFSNEKLGIIKDAYVKTRDTECEYVNFISKSHVKSGNESVAYSTKIKRSDVGLENLKDVAELVAEFKAPSVTFEGTTCKIDTDAVFSGIACEIAEDGSENLIPVKFTENASLNVNIACHIPEGASAQAKLSSALCELNADSEYIYVSCTPTFTYSISCDRSETVLSKCMLVGDAEYRGGLSKINVYYPDKNETLFDIAKKFHTTAADIAKDNNLNELTALDSSGFELSCGHDKLIIR